MKAELRAERGHPDIGRHARFLREMPVFLVELDQRFRMFGDKGDRQHDEGLALGARAADLVVGRGPDPFQRPDAALVAGHPVQTLDPEFCHYGSTALLDLGLIGIALFDHLLRQSMSREEDAESFMSPRIADGLCQ